MWDKKETGARPAPEPATAAQKPPAPTMTPAYTPEPVRTGRSANIGASIQIKGELQGDEDLTIDGRVEGKIELRDHNLTIGANGRIKADLYAKHIVISGEVTGNAFAAERVEIAPSGRLNGNITAPRITIADGAHFKGSVDMERAQGARGSSKDEVHRMTDVATETAKNQPRL